MSALREAAVAAMSTHTRLVQDFPAPGVLFRDLTPVFAHGPSLHAVAAAVAECCGEVQLYAGLEARGFILAAAAAAVSGSGMLVVRKAGKLPGAVLGEDYELEYGTARIELHPDDVPAGARVAIVDDVLATGGTAAAAIRLIERAGGMVSSVVVALEIDALGGRAALGQTPVHALQHV